MKKAAIKLFCVILVFTFVLPLIPFASFSKAVDCEFYLSTADNPTLPFNIGSYYDDDGSYYLFVPNSLDEEELVVRCNREVYYLGGEDVTEWNREEGYFKVIAGKEISVNVNDTVLTFMYSALPSVSISVKNGYSIDTIHADKEAKIKAKVEINGAEKEKYNLASTDIEMKTRGNTTFWPDKKPYQIKFDKKTDLFGMGKAKKWLLLANYYDGTSIKNKVFFDLANEIGMKYTSKSVFVDLYIDGDYRGVYELCEKVEVGSERVPLENDYGVILEMESSLRLDAVNDIFMTTYESNKDLVYKDYVTDFEDVENPEALQKRNEVMDFVENYIYDFEDELYSENSDWEKLSSMIDVDSFILYYFLNEYGEQVDCMMASTYFYIDGPGVVLHCGPIWDFDRVCAFDNDYETATNADFVKNMVDSTDQYRVDWYKELFRHPEFAKRANELYDEVIKDAFDTEKVNSMIDSYQNMLMPSLRMNHVKWVVFHDRSYTADELCPGGPVDWIGYTTDFSKKFLGERKAYIDSAYGVEVPIITYSVFDEKGNMQKAYAGGSITYETNVAGLKIDICDSAIDGDIEYKLNIDGNVTEPVKSGEVLRSANGFRRFNAMSINLTGNLANYFSIEYRVYIGGRWGTWAADGKTSGRSSSNNGKYYVSRVQIRLRRKNEVKYGTVELIAPGSKKIVKNVVAGNIYSVDLIPKFLGYAFKYWSYDAGGFEPFTDGMEIEDGKTYTLYACFDPLTPLAGDLNCDGEVSSADSRRLKMYIVGLIGDFDIALGNADIDGDGEITSKDSRILKAMIVS